MQSLQRNFFVYAVVLGAALLIPFLLNTFLAPYLGTQTLSFFQFATGPIAFLILGYTLGRRIGIAHTLVLFVILFFSWTQFPTDGAMSVLHYFAGTAEMRLVLIFLLGFLANVLLTTLKLAKT